MWFSPNTYEVIVKVDREVAHYFKQKTIIPNQKIIKTLENGELLISIKAGHYNQVLPIVRYWIPHIKIVSPDELRDKLMGELKKYVDDGK